MVGEQGIDQTEKMGKNGLGVEWGIRGLKGCQHYLGPSSQLEKYIAPLKANNFLCIKDIFF